MPSYEEHPLPDTPRKRAVSRQAQKTFLMEAIRNASAGDKVSLLWRIISPEDEGWESTEWIEWTGVILSGEPPIVQWDTTCAECEEYIVQWPPFPALEPTWVFQVKQCSLKRKPPKLRMTPAARPEDAPIHEETQEERLQQNVPIQHGAHASGVREVLQRQQRDELATNLVSQQFPQAIPQVPLSEAIGEAIKGESAKTAIAVGLKVVSNCPRDLLWVHPWLFIGDPEGWNACFRSYQIATGTIVRAPAKALIIEQQRKLIQNWIVTPVEVQSVDHFCVVITAVACILSQFILFNTHTYSKATRFTFQIEEALAKGSVDIPQLYRTATLQCHAEENATGRARGRGYGRENARGRSWGFRGRGTNPHNMRARGRGHGSNNPHEQE